MSYMVHCHLFPHYRWIDVDGNEQRSKQVYLDNFGNDREYGKSDIYKGQMVARFFEGLNDLLDFYPQDRQLQLLIKLDSATAHFFN